MQGLSTLEKNSEKGGKRASKMCLRTLKKIKSSGKTKGELIGAIENKGRVIIDSRAKWELQSSADVENDFKTESAEFTPGIFSAERLGLEKGMMRTRSKELNLRSLSRRDVLELVDQYSQPNGECLVIPVPEQDAAFVLTCDAKGSRNIEFRSGLTCGGSCKLLFKLASGS